METGKTQYRYDPPIFDSFAWYLTSGPLADLDQRALHEQKPTWTNFVNHPNYDSFWKEQAVNLILTKTTVPNLNVAGWWDQEDYYGPMKIYETFEKDDADHKNYVVIGPWRHGGWGGEGKALGPIDFGGDQSKYFREKIVKRPGSPIGWQRTRDRCSSRRRWRSRQAGNSWERYDSWPPGDRNRKCASSYTSGFRHVWRSSMFARWTTDQVSRRLHF